LATRLERLKFLVDVGGGITPEHALAGKQPSKFVETFVSTRSKLAELPSEFFEFLAKLAKQTKGMVFRTGHGV